MMKVITVAEAAGRLPEIIYAVTQGEHIVLKDGVREVTLRSRAESFLDLEEDSPELEAELLKAAEGPFVPYSPENLDAIAQRVLERRRKQ